MLDNNLIVKETLERIHGTDTSLTLIAADVDRVQSYVFESAKLPEMRGASLILDLLNVKDSDELKWGDVNVKQGIPQLLHALGLPPESLVYAGGGGASILAPAEKAEEIQRHIEQLYVATTETATITVVRESLITPDLEQLKAKAQQAQGAAWQLLRDNLVREDEWNKCETPDKLTDKHFQRAQGFGASQAAAGYKLRRAKLAKPTAPVFEVSPFTERCGYCHFRPACKIAAEIDERPICRICNFKRQDRPDENFAESFYLNDFHNYLNQELRAGRMPNYLCGGRKGAPTEEEAAEYINTWHEIKPPRDLEAVAKAAAGKVNNFVGIIYADGNNMGAKLNSFATKDEFKQFAEEVRKIMKQAVYSGLGQLLDGHRFAEYERRADDRRRQRQHYKHHPFEIITIGGDDVYLFVPADVALEMALHLCREFDHAFNGELTLAVGVLIAHHMTPIYFSRSIAKGLLKHAKKLSKAQTPVVSAIDFQVITADTAISEDVEGFRKQTYRNHYQNEGLTTRPLTVQQFEELLATARRLKAERFPKAQLHVLREAVVRGPRLLASNFYHYQRGRSREMERTYQTLHDFLSAHGEERLLPFWRNKEGWREAELITPLADLAEIYDFVRNKEEQQ